MFAPIHQIPAPSAYFYAPLFPKVALILALLTWPWADIILGFYGTLTEYVIKWPWADKMLLKPALFFRLASHQLTLGQHWIVC